MKKKMQWSHASWSQVNRCQMTETLVKHLVLLPGLTLRTEPNGWSRGVTLIQRSNRRPFVVSIFFYFEPTRITISRRFSVDIFTLERYNFGNLLPETKKETVVWCGLRTVDVSVALRWRKYQLCLNSTPGGLLLLKVQYSQLILKYRCYMWL